MSERPRCPDCDELMEWQPCMYEAGQLKNSETFEPCPICQGAGGYWVCPGYEREVTEVAREVNRRGAAGG